MRFDGDEVFRQVALRDRQPRHGPDLPDHQGAGGDARDRQHDARGARPARASTSSTCSIRPGAVRSREREVREEAHGAARGLQPDEAGRRLRRHALRRPAQAAGAGPGADGEAEAAAARRADGRHQPDARQAPARPHAAAAGRGWRHIPLHRARHGGGDEPLRQGRRDGRGQGDRQRRATRGPRGRAGDRRLPRRVGRGGRRAVDGGRARRAKGNGKASGPILTAEGLVAGLRTRGGHPHRRPRQRG